MKIHVLTAGLAMVLIVSACSHKDEKKQATAEIPEVAVALPVIDSVTLHNVYPGYLAADNTVDVVARVNGTLESINFNSGQYVTKGQVLFTIESTTYADAVKRAEASLQNARSEQEYCAKRLSAMEKAYASNAVSQMDVAQARNNLVQAQAAISSATAELNDAKTNLNYCTVRAPLSGYITQSSLDPGNYVGGGVSPVVLTTIYDTTQVIASFSIEDSQFEKLVGKSGGTAEPMYRHVPLTFQQELPHTYTADIYYSAPNVERSTGTMTMKGILKNPYNELKDGMFVSIDLPYGTEPHAVLVRDASISTDQRGKFLYVVNANDEVEYRPVTVGQLYQDTLRIIDSGLSAGERYVTEALLIVRPGMKVKPLLEK